MIEWFMHLMCELGTEQASSRLSSVTVVIELRLPLGLVACVQPVVLQPASCDLLPLAAE